MTELNRAQLQRLLTVGRSLVAELDLEAVLQQVLEAARDLSGARYAAIGIVDEGRERLERFLFVGIDEDTRERIGPLPQGKGVLGELIRNPVPLRLANVGEHPSSYGFPPHHPPMKTFLGAPVMIRGEAFGNIYLTDKEGGEFDDTDEEMLIVLADWAAVAIGNARLYAGAEQRRAELERAVEGLQATAELSNELSGVTELDRVLEVIVKWGRALVNARSFAVLLRREDQLVVCEVAGELGEEAVGRGLTLAEGSPLPEAYANQVSRRLVEADPIVETALEIPHTEMLVSPLVFRGEAEGLLLAFDSAGERTFGPDDLLLIESFTVSAATAIASAQSVEREKMRLSIASSEQERRRWAMELHDETLQELGALKVMQESALNRGEEELTKQLVQRSIAQLERTIESLETLITELRPAALDDLGVRPALDNLVRRVADENGLVVHSQIDLAYDKGRQPTRLSPDIEATLYRVVQEAFNNVIKHSGATEVTLSIAEADDALRVRVQDNGSGFDPGARTGRFGLMGMRERVELVGGELEVHSRRGEGTRVSARLPVDRVDDNGAG